MYELIDLTVNEEQLNKNVQRAKERNIIIPTFKQMKNPELIPEKVKEKVKEKGLWDFDPINLFRITWKNEPKAEGGGFTEVPNYIEIPKEITGVDTKIVAMAGKYFPTGSHKVGPTLGCLVPALITGQFDPTYHQAVWPSTGNYCRGGAFNSHLLACESIAILPEGMSRERFEWLKQVAGEVFATPGSESNVKEIYDKTWELVRTRENVFVFNQFSEFGNPLWHYEVTGHAIEDMLKDTMTEDERFFGSCFTSGSAGTTHAGEYLKTVYNGAKLAVGEAVQCPTLYNNGYGAHRIEGIGDKHVPWIHNIRNTDMIIAIDDADAMAMFRLFNEPDGHEYLRSLGVSDDLISKLSWVGISGAANILMAIKMAKYYDLGSKDVIATVLTDSAEMYKSRIVEMREAKLDYNVTTAAVEHARHVLGVRTDYTLELTYTIQKRIHNLKYYTWIEQQGKTVEELDAQWYDAEEYWGQLPSYTEKIDKLIEEFNSRTGLLSNL
jgi:cysteine synthase A